MVDKALIFNEPSLEFRYGQTAIDPHDGLALCGSYDADEPTRPGTITKVFLGTSEGIDLFRNWSKAMLSPCINAPADNFRLWPPYPGFEVAFNSEWSVEPVQTFEIDNDELINLSRNSDPYKRTYKVVDKYLEGLRIASKLENIRLGICIVPDEVWLNCRIQSRPSDPIGQKISARKIKSRKAGQLEIFESFNQEQYRLSTDFRRQLKARSMEYGIPIQIIRESTLRLDDEVAFGERGLTPLSDRMWNIATTLYYKSGGKPWKLLSAREGVCYIGISFRRVNSIDGDDTTACCAAQMFLNTGDGLVFLGEFGPWYSPRERQFHLTKVAAKSLLAGILQTYQELEGKRLKEVFLHSHSNISDEEFEGYLEACPEGVQLVGIRVRRDRRSSLKFYRLGEMPVLRGTFWQINENSGLLWGSGFVPRLATYKGWETPIPLRIDIQHGQAPIERVAHDILGLTKLNYNACDFGDAEPVTIKFSNAVGEILISNPTITTRQPHFKFYI